MLLFKEYVNAQIKCLKIEVFFEMIICNIELLTYWSNAFKTKVIRSLLFSPCHFRILITYTRNIGLRKFMGVTERVTFTDDLVTNRTKVDKEVWIDSEIVGLRSAIRKFGIDRFKRNCVSATNGFDCVINRMFGQTSNPLASKKQDSTTQTPGHQRTSGFRGQQLRQ